MRMLHEKSVWKDAVFVTLTYSEENLPLLEGRSEPLSTLQVSDLQKFFKKLRRRIKKLKYYACGEYGEKPGSTNRPHYHAVVFGVPFGSTTLVKSVRYAAEDNPIFQSWRKGNVVLGTVTEDSIRYVAQYIDKKVFGRLADDHYNGRVPEFQVCSQRIGLQWLKENMEDVLYDGCLKFRGSDVAIPRYYRKKLAELWPEAADGLTDRLAAKLRISGADESLSIAPEFGGRLVSQMSLEERHKFVDLLARRTAAVDERLRARGKFNAAQKRSKL